MNKPVFGELFLDRSDGRNAIHLFTAQSSPLEVKNLGRAFALIEFEQAETYTEEIVQTIDETFTNAYYRSTDFEIEAAFERALHKVNAVVHDLINKHGEAWVYQCNALLGVIHDSTVHLSTTGKVEGYLIQADTITDIIQRSQSTEVQPLKLFSALVSGKCPDRGGLLFTTVNLLDYLSLEKLRRTVKDHTATDAVDYLNAVLSEHDALSNIAAFVIKFERATTTTSTNPEDAGALDRSDFSTDSDSMSKLIDQERTTGDLLTPSIWPALKKKMQYVGTQSAGKTEQRRAVSENYAKSQNAFVNGLQLVGRFLLNAIKQILLVILAVVRWIGQLLLRLFKNRDSISATVGGSMSGAAGWWKRLSLAQKIFVAFLAATVVVFTISILTTGQSSEESKQNEAYATALQQVGNILGETESKQLMQDETGARTSLAEAKDVLSTVPQDSAAYATTGADLQSRIDQLDNTLNKVTVLDNPTLVGDFSTSTGAATIGSITQIGKNIFGFAQGSAGIWRLNVEKQEVSTVLSDDASIAGYKSIENDTAATTLVLVEKADFLQFNPVLEKTSPVDVALKDDELVAVDFDTFGDRLYVLSATANRIVRLQKTGNSYATPTSWLADGVDVSTAVSFDIDASIYILHADGAIKKYDDGNESEFAIDVFSPSLAGATHLVKNDPADPFVILNPTTQRVVVLDTNGKLQAQYRSAAFGQATDVLYDAATKTIYVVAANKVYSIGL